MKEKYLEKIVIETIQKYKLIQNGDKIVLGVSGGPDSICMLNILDNIRKHYSIAVAKADTKTSQTNPEPLAKINQLNPEPMANFDIIVAHVNHLIREEAGEDEKYVKQFCEEKNIKFYTKSIDVKEKANTNKIGVEEAGRIARYNFFEEVAKLEKANKIAIAHNKNDSTETTIMHLIRGSGTLGLRGIEPKRGNIIRPLIDCERSEIEHYCKILNLNPRIDKTNEDNTYTRNRIRNVVIPYLQKEFNSNIVETIDRLSKLIREEEEYIEKQVILAYEQVLKKEEIQGEQIILDLKQFNKQEKVIKARLILYTIKRLLGSSEGIEKIHIEDIIKLCQKNIGNKFLTPNKKIKILVKNHQIYFVNQI